MKQEQFTLRNNLKSLESLALLFQAISQSKGVCVCVEKWGRVGRSLLCSIEAPRDLEDSKKLTFSKPVHF